jgi:hypothetical protein
MFSQKFSNTQNMNISTDDIIIRVKRGSARRFLRSSLTVPHMSLLFLTFRRVAKIFQSFGALSVSTTLRGPLHHEVALTRRASFTDDNDTQAFEIPVRH